MSITADKETAVVEQAPTQLYIGGEWRDASGGETLGVEDPSTGDTLVEVADATGFGHDKLIISPPYVISEAEIDTLIERFELALRDALS